MHEFHVNDLSFRPLTASDFATMHLIWTDEYVRKYLFDDRIISEEQTQQEIELSIENFRKHGYGLWAVSVRSTSKIFGVAGYREFNDPPELQLLYGLLPDYASRGYGTAMARAMIEYGFTKLNFSEIAAAADVPNKASIRVMQKAGMVFRGRSVVKGLKLVSYHIRRQDWERQGKVESMANSKLQIPNSK